MVTLSSVWQITRVSKPFGDIKWLKGRKWGGSVQRARERRVPVLGWFLVSGDEGFRKSIVFRLD